MHIKTHFGNCLRMFLSFTRNLKQKSSDIRTRMIKERCSEANIRDVTSYRSVTNHVMLGSNLKKASIPTEV